jgi:hypothetical protein
MSSHMFLQNELTADELHFQISHSPQFEYWIDKILITPHDIASVSSRHGCLTDNVINAYLTLFTRDSMPPQGVVDLKLPFFILDTLDTTQIRDQTSQVPFKPPPFANSHRSKRILWIPKVRHQSALHSWINLSTLCQTDIFQFSHLILPWHVPVVDHWLCIGVNMLRATIRIYDSLASKITYRHQQISEVVRLSLVYYTTLIIPFESV